MNNTEARMTFENAKRALYKTFNPDNRPGFNVEKFKLTQSFLRLEQPTVVGQTLYTFPILINQPNPTIFNTEQRLNLQDSFVVNELGFYQALPSSSTDTTFKLLTYVSPFLFVNDAQHQIFYNGKLSITVNNNVIMPAWDTVRHQLAPQTQQTQALGAGAPMDQFDGKSYAMYPVEPNITLVGSKNYVVNLTLPSGPTAVEANSRIVVILRGILAQNSTVVS